jgi:hypothetical protein
VDCFLWAFFKITYSSSPKFSTFSIENFWAIFSQTHQGSMYVMIAIFCDFRQFSAKKCCFLNQCYDSNYAKTSSFDQKCQFFGENIFKIITSVPGCPVSGAKRREERVRSSSVNGDLLQPFQNDCRAMDGVQSQRRRDNRSQSYIQILNLPT